MEMINWPLLPPDINYWVDSKKQNMNKETVMRSNGYCSDTTVNHTLLVNTKNLMHIPIATEASYLQKNLSKAAFFVLIPFNMCKTLD